MYPVLTEYLLGGTREQPRLLHKRRTLVYPLPSPAVASIVAGFDGQRTVAQIASAHGIPERSLRVFVDKLAEKEIVEVLSSPCHRSVVSQMGPREPWLAEVHIDVTDRCNLARHCPHCYRGDLLNLRRERSLDDWLKVIDDLAVMGVQRIAISGGEPFLFKGLPRLIEYATDRNILVSGIFTNGTVYNSTARETLQVLLSRRLHSSFYVSLDGPDAESNDRYRGRGSFEKTMRFLRTVCAATRDSLIDVTVNSQVHIGNVDRLCAWYDQLKTIGITRWRMNAGRMTGRLLDHQDLVVTDQKLVDAYVQLIRLHIADWRSGSIPFRINVESVFRTESLRDGTVHIFAPDLPICDYKRNACSIEPTGDVQFCTSWTSRRFGNVFTDGLEAIWYGQELQSLKNMRISEVTGCTDCPLLPYCGGGCRHTAPSLTSPDKMTCARYRLCVEHIVPILREEGVVFVV